MELQSNIGVLATVTLCEFPRQTGRDKAFRLPSGLSWEHKPEVSEQERLTVTCEVHSGSQNATDCW